MVIDSSAMIAILLDEPERAAFDRQIEADAIRLMAALRQFGKGRHRAGLKIGGCFAYAAAKATGERLLFMGNDFTHTDIPSALPA